MASLATKTDHQVGSAASANTVASASFTWNAGDYVVAQVLTGGATVNSVTVSGLTFTKVTTNGNQDTWTATAVGSGSGAVTANLGSTVSCGIEVTSYGNNGGFDAFGVANGTVGGTSLTGTVTTTTANCTVIAMHYCFLSTVGAAGAGYTTNGTNATNGASATANSEIATALTASASTVTPARTVTNSGGDYRVTCISLKQVVVLPTAPAAPTTNTPTTTSINVNPGALTANATSLNIQVTTAADTTFASPVATITGGTASSNNAVTGLTAGTNYIFRTQMVNASGTVSGTATATVPTLFAAPTALAVAAVANTTQLSLTWTIASGNATKTYNVLRSTTNGSGYSSVATGLVTNSYTDNTGLAGGTNYYYVVQQVDSSGASANSAQGTGVVLTCPSAPAGLTGTPSLGYPIQVALTWSASTGATSYNVYRSDTLGGVYSLLALGTGLTTTNFTDSTVVFRTSYYYRVSAANATGEGPLSSASAQEYIGVDTPTGLVATVQAGVGILLTWTAPSGYTGTGYNIYRASNASHNGVPHRKYNEQPFVVIPWGTNSYTDRLVGLAVLSGSNVYTYYVTTVNGVNESALSSASTPVTFNG